MSIDLLEGTDAAPPRDNGELVFSEPWQARAFGLAADLVDGGHLTWDEFREHVIETIATWEATSRSDEAPEAWDYYRCWLIALEQAVADHGLLAAQALANRAERYAARPSGHDH
ncbi:nitrile hydratase accessory protein [Candidatus Poriferisodalis sp.]|uniref:nitrile hydratase accessory protein n=1 Tax=Candidatus Poriferisodalis sp. TaxID=3101277 RepID=UPI003B58DF28